MATSDMKQVLERLERIENDLNDIKLEMAETRGAYRLAKFVIALLGVSGLGGILAWMSNQGK